jgi:hypothetical protein
MLYDAVQPDAQLPREDGIQSLLADDPPLDFAQAKTLR